MKSKLTPQRIAEINREITERFGKSPTSLFRCWCDDVIVKLKISPDRSVFEAILSNEFATTDCAEWRKKHDISMNDIEDELLVANGEITAVNKLIQPLNDIQLQWLKEWFARNNDVVACKISDSTLVARMVKEYMQVVDYFDDIFYYFSPDHLPEHLNDEISISHWEEAVRGFQHNLEWVQREYQFGFNRDIVSEFLSFIREKTSLQRQGVNERCDYLNPNINASHTSYYLCGIDKHGVDFWTKIYHTEYHNLLCSIFGKDLANKIIGMLSHFDVEVSYFMNTLHELVNQAEQQALDSKPEHTSSFNNADMCAALTPEPTPEPEQSPSVHAAAKDDTTLLDFMILDNAEQKQKLLDVLHKLLDGKKGKHVALAILVCERHGLLRKPPHHALKSVFGDIGTKSGYNNYYAKGLPSYTDEQIKGIETHILPIINGH